MIIDTHVHLYDSRYDNIDDEVNEALKANVKKMIIVGFDKATSIKAVELANKYPFMYVSVGLHPSEVLKEKDKELSWIKELLIDNNKIVAIGEIGLDYYWDKSFIDEQKEMFKKQIAIAREYDLPIIIHSRDATQDCFDIIKDSRVKGVMHCFGSSLEMAREFVKKGFYIGVGGVVTFTNAKDIKEVVRDIDLKYILSETDSPYLTPAPFRGKLNRPCYVKYVVEEIAKIKDLENIIVEEQLENNVYNLFNRMR